MDQFEDQYLAEGREPLGLPFDEEANFFHPEEVQDEEFHGAQQVEESIYTDDPVRVYLREMGSVKLLNREGEIGIARRIEQISRDVLQLNEGTLYTALLRLQQQGWITSTWGASENNRRAKFYSITRAGRKQLASEADNWERISGVIARLLRLASQE